MTNYTGCIYLSDEQAAKFYSKNYDGLNLVNNEYIIIQNDVYRFIDGVVSRVSYPSIDSQWNGVTKPRNVEQVAAIDMLKDEATTIKLITGTWGTGKTLLESAFAINQLEEDKFDKIVFVRNNVAVKDTTELGALPGDALDKLLPYVMPLADHCGGVDGVMRLIETGRLEVVPLGFLRGRSIRNSIIMCTEAENLTKEHIQLIMARVDEGSILIMDADTRQRDKAVFEKSKGVETLIDRLAGNKLFGYVHLIKSERSETAALADLLND